MKAHLTNYRQSPRKVRLVTDAVRGKSVTEALAILAHMPKRAATPIEKLLVSAVANAKNAGLDMESLRVASVNVDKGIVMKRFMPRARGRGAQILKRTSHVTLTLDQGAISKKNTRRARAGTPKTS